jgi:iron complex outermembrane recepter protein
MKKKLCLFLIVIFGALSAVCYAEENKDEEKTILDEIVVTATRNTDTVRNVPASVTIITPQDIKKSGASNVAELLEKQANIHFRNSSGNSSQAQIDLRGFGGDNPFGKTLVLLNGRRLNRPDMKSINWLQIPIQQIEKIEVVKGSNTVLYGDSAVAGVINIITKKGSREIKTDASMSIGSNNTNITRAGITGSKDRLSFAFNAENYNTDGWKERTAFYNKGAGLNLGYDLTDTLIFNVNASFSENKYEMPGSLTKEQIEDDPKQPQSDNHWEDESLSNYTDFSMTAEKMTDKFGDIELKFVYGKKDIDSDMTSWANYSSYNIDTIGFLPKYKLKREILGFENKFIIGTDIYNETLDLDRYSDKERETKTGRAKIEKNSIGFYARDEIYIKEDLITTIGFRNEKAQFKAQEFNSNDVKQLYDDDTFNENAFELGIVKIFENKIKTFGKFSKIYRFPFIDEKINYSGYGTSGFNTQLEPEKGKSYEIGGSFSPFNKLNMDITLFNINMEDEIAYNGTTSKNENFGKTKHQGIEFSIDYNIKNKINLYGNYTYNNATFENGEFEGNEIPLVPNHNIMLGFDALLPYGLSFSGNMQYVSEAYLSGDNANDCDEKLDAYTIYDVFLKYSPVKSIFKNITPSAFVGIKNLFDKEYSTMGFRDTAWAPIGFYPSAAREFTGGISFNF